MRQICGTLILPLFAVVAVACKPSVPQETDAPVVSVPPAAPTIAAQMLAELPVLDAQHTLAQWKLTHPNDSVEKYAATVYYTPEQSWCVRTVGTTAADSAGHTLTRIAYFYPPTQSQPAQLQGPGGDALLDKCVLGLFWIESKQPDSVAAAATAQRAILNLSSTLGAPNDTVQRSWSGAAFWLDRKSWISDSLVIITAHSRRTIQDPRSPDGLHRYAFAGATRQTATRRLFDFYSSQAELNEQTRVRSTAAARTREMILAAASDSAATRAMLSTVNDLIPGVESEQKLTQARRNAVIAAFEQWMKAATALNAQRRAAALLAADALLSHSRYALGWGEQSDSVARKRLEAIGARFDFSPLGLVHVYTRSWLKDAYASDQQGSIGDIAFVQLLELGFETSGTCRDQRGEGFRAVIERGEQFLRDRKDSQVRDDVEFMVGHAYADIVRLAMGGAYMPEDTLKYRPELARAREMALVHFRSALTSYPSNERAAAAWETAWRLHGGIAPGRTWFYCVYD